MAKRRITLNTDYFKVDARFVRRSIPEEKHHEYRVLHFKGLPGYPRG